MLFGHSPEGGNMALSQVEEYGELTHNQWVAVANKLGKAAELPGVEAVKGLLSGELDICVVAVIRSLFTKLGFRIPQDLEAKARDPNKSFYLEQLKPKTRIDYANLIMGLQGAFVDLLPLNIGVACDEFKEEIERLVALLQEDPRVQNILNSVCLPIIMPKLEYDDLGEALEFYVEAAGQAYRKAFPERVFTNYRKGALANHVSVVEGSRHEQLIERMRQGPVIGLHFPNPLQGFSIHAAREQMDTLPQGFVLSGMDTPIAMAMYPKTLARDYNTPALDLAALQWQSAADSLCFKAGDAELSFGSTGSLAAAGDNDSGGLLFLG